MIPVSAAGGAPALALRAGRARGRQGRRPLGRRRAPTPRARSGCSVRRTPAAPPGRTRARSAAASSTAMTSRLRAHVGAGASALVATQASTKAYPLGAGREPDARGDGRRGRDPRRALGSARAVRGRARRDAARRSSSAPDATVVAVESLAAGRVASGERWAAARAARRACACDAIGRHGARRRAAARSRPRRRVRAHGPLRRLGHRRPERPGRARCGDRRAAGASAARDTASATDVEAIELASPFEGGCLLRIAAASTAILSNRVREALACVAPLLGDDPFTRRW